MTPRTVYRSVAVAEAVTWTLLIGALVVRAIIGEDRGGIAVTVGGSVHGFVFLLYGATAVLTAVNQRWSVGVGALAVVAAVIPYATIPVEIWLARSGRLDGVWRREATDDPRDRRPLDRLVRWMLRHPLLLIVLVVVVVAALFTVLLLLGPPVPRD